METVDTKTVDLSEAANLAREELEESPLDLRRQIHKVFREIEEQIQRALNVERENMHAFSDESRRTPGYLLYKDIRAVQEAGYQFASRECRDIGTFLARGTEVMNAQALLSTAGVLSEVAGNTDDQHDYESIWGEKLEGMREHWSKITPFEGGSYSVQQDSQDLWNATLQIHK